MSALHALAREGLSWFQAEHAASPRGQIEASRVVFKSYHRPLRVWPARVLDGPSV